MMTEPTTDPAAIGHALRDPLHVATGYAQMLEQGLLGELTPRQAVAVGAIARSVARMRTILDDLGV